MKSHCILPILIGTILSLVPSLIFSQDKKETSGKIGNSDTDRISKIEQKLRDLTIESIEFAETPLRDCLEFLQQRAKEADPEGVGVDFIFDIDSSPGGTLVQDTLITLRLSNVPLVEAVRYTTALAQLEYKVEPHAVVIVPLSTPDALYTNVYQVPPTFLKSGGGGDVDAVGPADPIAPDAGGASLSARENARETLESAGITFGEGASAVYNPASSQLIVRNTQDQMELVEAYVDAIKETPEKEIFIILEVIEVQAIEFSDWLQENTLDKNATVLRKEVQEWVKSGRGKIRETLTVQARSGQRAKVETIEEAIYPTEFIPPPKKGDSSPSEEEDSAENTAPEKAFETRNIGATLEVDPVYSPEGFVDINLSPELVISDQPFTYDMGTGSGRYTVELPRFVTCKITTQITVRKGEYGYLGNARLGMRDESDGGYTILLIFIRSDFD